MGSRGSTAPASSIPQFGRFFVLTQLDALNGSLPFAFSGFRDLLRRRSTENDQARCQASRNCRRNEEKKLVCADILSVPDITQEGQLSKPRKAVTSTSCTFWPMSAGMQHFATKGAVIFRGRHDGKLNSRRSFGRLRLFDATGW